MISESVADESTIEKMSSDEPQAYIEVQIPSSEQIDVKYNSLDDMSDVSSDSDNLSPLFGFAPNEAHILLNMNRILDLQTRLKYRCDPRSIWYPDLPPILYRKRNHTERMDANYDTADDQSRCTTPLRVPKRRRQK